jgi:hypothetical protein
MGSSDYGTLYFPHNKTGVIAIVDDIPPAFSASADSPNGHVYIGNGQNIQLLGSNGISITTNIDGSIIFISGSGTGSGSSITVDSAMSSTSTNPVQNKVIKSYIDTRVPAPTSSDKGKFLKVNNSGVA